MRLHFIIIISIILLAGCSSQVAQDTTTETGKDIIESVSEGVETASENIQEAVPYIQEDITEGFWAALDAIDVLVTGDTPDDVPTPAEMKAIQVQQGIQTAVQKGVTSTARQIEEKSVTDAVIGFQILADTISKEIQNANTPDQAPGTEKQLPTPEEMQKAWTTLAKLSDSPEAARAMFKVVDKYVKENPEIGAQAGIVGPAAADKLGPKATEFLNKLSPGQVSEVVKFMKGYLIVQLIDNADGKYEVGYIYIPEAAEPPANALSATESASGE